MPLFIKLMRHEGVGQQIRADGPQRHLVKQGTPHHGRHHHPGGRRRSHGAARRVDAGLILAVAATLVTGSLGLLDDIESVAHGRSLGLTPSQKMVGLILISVTFCLVAVNVCGVPAAVRFPGGFSVDLGVLTTTLDLGGTVVAIPWLYLVFVFLLMAGLSNAVNLTDGLDGLAERLLDGGHARDGDGRLQLRGGQPRHLRRLDRVAPASAFSGTTATPPRSSWATRGRSPLGAAFASLAVLTKTEGDLADRGRPVHRQALSVMIRVLSFKATGKRVFLMAPIHHH